MAMACGSSDPGVSGTVSPATRLRLTDYAVLSVWASTDEWISGSCPAGDTCTTDSVETTVSAAIFPYPFDLPLPPNSEAKHWNAFASLSNPSAQELGALATAQATFEGNNVDQVELIVDFPSSTRSGLEIWPDWYCADQGGGVVLDSGGEETWQSTYVCPSGAKPLANVLGGAAGGACCSQ